MNDEHQNWDPRLIHRRDFLIGGVKVGLSFLALDVLSLSTFAQTPGTRMPLDQINLTEPPKIHDSLNTMAAYLVQYAPPAQNFPTSGAWKASYDLIGWVGAPRRTKQFSRKNTLLGGMIVTRRPDPAGKGVSYDCVNTMELNGFLTTLNSTMRCSADPLPRLLDWKTGYEKHHLRKSGTAQSLTEQGQHKEGVLTITSAAGTRRIKTDRPVAPQWAVLDALRGAKATPSDPLANVEFDLFHDLTSHRPHQRLTPCGILNLNLDGKSYTFHGFMQNGMGTLPTHYWIDENGRPLLATVGLSSLALTSLQPC